FDDISSEFNLNKGQINKVQRELHKSIEEAISDEHLTFKNHVNESFSQYQRNINEAQKLNDEKMIEDAQRTYEEDRDKIEQSFISEVNEKVESTLQDLVEEQMEKVEEKKKQTTEDDVRDHLRGFSRTIPAFLMAYGDENTTLSNFHENIDEDTFKELTSITLDEFKKLRDGFTFVDNDGVEKSVPGLFNEVVFNASIKEFLDTRHRLANYFDDELDEDIFDYIPPQQTNQIFTPKRVVKMMVDALEKENSNIFKDKTVKFADLYTKSGLYITEIVKKLDNGLKEEIPNREERIKWILENQVYACAPSNIIYNIVKNFIFGELEDVSTGNLIEVDTLKLASNEMLSDNINELFGDDKLKFDVIIGNPPYQDETIGDNKTYAPPIYHKFLEESYKLASKVEMIHPARFLFNAGSTPKAWNRKMLSDKSLKVIKYFEDSSIVFPNTDIKGGIVITYRDVGKVFGEIGTFTIHEELNGILKKVSARTNETLDSYISGRGVYKLSPLVT
uniref:Eco57I restriction-modification methylase domain-containing protein n=1 Tax=Nosocomiicoccus massiliensis TaxID=1232430 RepID=UPI001EE31801